MEEYIDIANNLFKKILHAIKLIPAGIKYVWDIAWMRFYRVPKDKMWLKVITTIIQVAIGLFLLYLVFAVVITLLFIAFFLGSLGGSSSSEQPTNTNHNRQNNYRQQREYEIFLLEEDRRQKEEYERDRIRRQMKAL